MYVDYDFYRDVYFGSTVSSADFSKYEKKASFYLEYMTFNKCKNPLNDDEAELVKYAMCSTIDLLNEYDKNVVLLRANQTNLLETGIKTESVKSHSITFSEYKGNSEIQMLKGIEDLIFTSIRKYLLPVGMLYRGS